MFREALSSFPRGYGVGGRRRGVKSSERGEWDEWNVADEQVECWNEDDPSFHIAVPSDTRGNPMYYRLPWPWNRGREARDAELWMLVR